jgi:hypothetical protein
VYKLSDGSYVESPPLPFPSTTLGNMLWADGDELISDAPPVKDNVAGPPSASIVTGVPAVVVTPASMPSVAQQVGELLGATRVGAVESGQAASPASTTGDARANTPAQKSPAPARSSEGPTTQTSSRRPEEVETKEASPFERLVRSIRLQTG